MTTSPRRTASSTWGRGRGLLLAAAAELFGRQGYESTTTREIAEVAGVSEQMVFRHFGSKANLFEAAAVAPFIEHLDRYIADWEQRPHGVLDAVEETVDLYRGLLTVFTANRALLAALATVGTDHDAPSDAVAAAIGPAIDRFADLLRTEQVTRGFRDFDVAIVVRLVAGLAMSQSLFADVLYPSTGAGAPSLDAVIHEMAMLSIHGVWPPEAHSG